MRLLNIKTLTFKEFPNDQAPSYIAASHRWSIDETCHKDFRKGRNIETVGYKKVQSFCEAIKRMNAATRSTRILRGNSEWLWVDTACIDKTSSADVTESITSMFRIYAECEACYAFLHDVGPVADQQNAIHDLVKSEWFERGWTLQELLAPKVVIFFTRTWDVLGHKCPLEECEVICNNLGMRLNTKVGKITKIPAEVLCSYQRHGSKYEAEEKKKWANGRVTTRTEDRAYCLLGLLDVRLMPMYGEGSEAWDRLADAVEKHKKEKQATAPIRRPVRGADGMDCRSWIEQSRPRHLHKPLKRMCEDPSSRDSKAPRIDVNETSGFQGPVSEPGMQLTIAVDPAWTASAPTLLDPGTSHQVLLPNIQEVSTIGHLSDPDLASDVDVYGKETISFADFDELRVNGVGPSHWSETWPYAQDSHSIDSFSARLSEIEDPKSGYIAVEQPLITDLISSGALPSKRSNSMDWDTWIREHPSQALDRQN